MEVYLDILILENTIVNAFLLSLTAQLMRRKVKFKFILLASFIGSLYVLVLLYPALQIFSSFLFKLLISVTMILITFRIKDFFFNIKSSLVFIFSSFILAGVCFFIQLNTAKFGALDLSLYNFTYKKLFISIMIVYIFVNRTLIFLKDRNDINAFVYDVDIGINGTVKKLKAFLDTGNELREPSTNLPVIIVQKKLFSNLKINDQDKYYIPYMVIDGNKGLLEAFKPESVKIYSKTKTKNKIINIEAIIAISEIQLSKYNEYDALLSRGII
jgi:stage II sporulation protein GA (sporulation sigma-E factor processing peptidase)